jgi:putative colanic acid biosynthesis acetyltransferase WcaF
MSNEKITYKQSSPYSGPRPAVEVLLQALWQLTWKTLCSWTPKPFNPWRLFWLRLFGAQVRGYPFVHQSARIAVPWNLTMEDRSALGERANVYNLGKIVLKARSTVAQEAYLCSATHEFSDPNLPLQTSPIIVGEDVFLGARAFVLPGVTIGDGAVIGACSVVTKDVASWAVAVGNPCRVIRTRTLNVPPLQAE